jgi:hypothetical protein
MADFRPPALFVRTRGAIMERDFPKEIEAIRQQIDDAVHKMQEIQNEFTAKIQPFVKKWIHAIARQYIARNPEKALMMGRDKLAALKEKVSTLSAAVESLCQETFRNKAFWPETRDLMTQNQLGIRMILGKLGTILEEFEFVKTKEQTEKDQESWNQYDSTGDRREFDGTLVYPHSIELPHELQHLLEEYRGLITRKDILAGDIKNLEFEKLKVQATTLWDSI